MKTVHYFYRYPDRLYFSIENLFSGIAQQINLTAAGDLRASEYVLPLPVGMLNLLKNIRFVKAHQGKINHITGDAHYAILGCKKENFNVLTIHDCVLLTQIPKTSSRYWLIKWVWYLLPVRKADMITVISERTKQDLIFYTNCDPEKIVVIGNYLDDSFVFSPYVFNERKPSVLFIGTAQNKNLNRLIEALTGMTVLLQIVGVVSDEQYELLRASGIEFAVGTQLTKQEMLEKYQACDLLAFPSLYEGFGLPIIEAQATGRPVLTSAVSPMLEVSGKGACLIDPQSASSIKQGILQIITDKAYRDKLIEEGRENAKRFERSAVVNSYLSLYLGGKKSQYA